MSSVEVVVLVVTVTRGVALAGLVVRAVAADAALSRGVALEVGM
jgi:hypothetical protein